MDPNKFAELQLQMKQNNAEYQSFLNSLDSWESDVKEKETKLKTSKAEENNLPPVRNSLQKKKKKKKKEKYEKVDDYETAKKKKIKGYDYRSWDKFDVEAACEEVDKRQSSESEYETDEEWEIERMKLLAVQHKQNGNQYFKEGKYDKAIECYTQGIGCDPENAVLPANRAMALLKEEKYAAAELDCSQSLAIDPGYLKALHRRGTARAALNKYQEAKEDFLKVLESEPKNKSAKAELEKVERLLNPPRLLQSKNLETSDVGIVKAVYKPPDQRSQKPLQRIAIEEIGDEEAREEQRTRIQTTIAQQSESKKDLTARDNAMFEQLVKDSPKLTNGLQKTQVIKDDLAEETSWNKTNGVDTALGGSDSVSHHSSCDGSSETRSRSEQTVQFSATADVTCADSPSVSPRLPSLPTSSFQFQADWKVLKSSADKFYQYFKEIDPASFPKLFGQFLDSDVLSKIFHTLKDFYVTNFVDPFPVLKSLCDVKRFSMTIMFMSPQDKQVLRDVFSDMRQKALHSTDHINSLAKKYQL